MQRVEWRPSVAAWTRMVAALAALDARREQERQEREREEAERERASTTVDEGPGGEDGGEDVPG